MPAGTGDEGVITGRVSSDGIVVTLSSVLSMVVAGVWLWEIRWHENGQVVRRLRLRGV